MIKVIKELTFDASHQLLDHKGLCKNVHGHTYKLQVTVMGMARVGRGSDQGMVIDFSDLKALIKDAIVEKYDHAFIACGDEPILKALEKLNLKTAVIGCRTTCENMAPIIFEQLRALVRAFNPNIDLVEVKLWETPTSFAAYGG